MQAMSFRGGLALGPIAHLPERSAGEQYLHELDIVEHTLAHVGLAAEIAREERETSSVSHRDFNVGVGVIAVDPSERNLYVYSGANVRRTPHIQTVCAEKYGLDRAEKDGMSFASMIVVAGTTDYKLLRTVMDRDSHTLYPCQTNCVPMFETHSMVAPDMLVVSTGHKKPQGEKYEAQSVAELAAFYTNPAPHPIEEIPFYDAHNGAFDQVAEVFAALRFGIERRKPHELPKAVDIALQALRTPTLERFVVLRDTTRGERHDVVSAKKPKG